jgi:acyl carrier protein
MAVQVSCYKGEEIKLDMESMMPKIQEAFRLTFNVEPESITIETTPPDVAGWDSMGHVALASALETIFSVSFDVDELMEMENVRQIVKIIGMKLAG